MSFIFQTEALLAPRVFRVLNELPIYVVIAANELGKEPGPSTPTRRPELVGEVQSIQMSYAPASHQ
jgi:hypothetical protein